MKVLIPIVTSLLLTTLMVAGEVSPGSILIAFMSAYPCVKEIVEDLRGMRNK